jgi:hypothetical protein
MSIPGKEKDKEIALNMHLYDLIDNEEENYVDLDITCFNLEDESKKILDNVPPVRVIFEESLS